MLIYRVRLVLLTLAFIGFISHQAGIENRLVRAQNVQEVQDSEESPECAAALQNAQNRIKKGRNVTIQPIEKSNISQEYDNYPQNRPYRYDIFLKGSATNSILGSTKLLTAISADIIKNCESVSMVVIGEAQSEAYGVWGLKENGKVELFTECLEPPITTKFRWGQISCGH